MKHRSRIHSGFTLPEMLVATALTIFIMIVLSGAFRAALDGFRTLRVAGQMQEKLRMAGSVIRRDLAAEHFTGNFSNGLSGAYLRNQRLDSPGWAPPEGGYFRIWQNPEGGDVGVNEGSDADGLPSTRATGHVLQFTARLNPLKTDEYFTANGPTSVMSDGIPGYSGSGSFASEWAEISYFLKPTGLSTAPVGATSTQLPLHVLCRKQRLLGRTGGKSVPSGSFAEISESGSVSNSPASVTDPFKRMDCDPNATTYIGPYQKIGGGFFRPQAYDETATFPGNRGDDILMTNVLSFEVKAYWVSLNNGTDVHSLAADADAPFRYLPPQMLNTDFASYGPARVFDTWTRTPYIRPGTPPTVVTVNYNLPTVVQPTTPIPGVEARGYLEQGTWQVPQRIRISSLQIRLRIWDTKSQTTRQVTIIQDV